MWRRSTTKPPKRTVPRLRLLSNDFAPDQPRATLGRVTSQATEGPAAERSPRLVACQNGRFSRFFARYAAACCGFGSDWAMQSRPRGSACRPRRPVRLSADPAPPRPGHGARGVALNRSSRQSACSSSKGSRTSAGRWPSRQAQASRTSRRTRMVTPLFAVSRRLM